MQLRHHQRRQFFAKLANVAHQHIQIVTDRGGLRTPLLQQWADWLRTRERYTPMYGGVHFHMDETCARSESNFVQAAPVPGWATPCGNCASDYTRPKVGAAAQRVAMI